MKNNQNSQSAQVFSLPVQDTFSDTIKQFQQLRKNQQVSEEQNQNSMGNLEALAARDVPLEKFYVQNFIREKLQNDQELRQTLLYQEDELFNTNVLGGSQHQPASSSEVSQIKLQSNMNTNIKPSQSVSNSSSQKNLSIKKVGSESRSIVNQQGVKLKSVGNSKDEIIKDLYQKIFSQPTNASGLRDSASLKNLSDKIHITNININTTNNNVFNGTLPSMRDSLKSSQINTRQNLAANLIGSRANSNSKINPGAMTERIQQLTMPKSQNGIRKSKHTVFHQSKTNTSPSKGISQIQELNMIFQNNKDAKLANFLIKMHSEQVKQQLSPKNSSNLANSQSVPNSARISRDISHRKDNTTQKDQMLNNLIFNQVNNFATNGSLDTCQKIQIIKNNKTESEMRKIEDLARFASDQFPIGHTEFKDFNFLKNFNSQNSKQPDHNIQSIFKNQPLPQRKQFNFQPEAIQGLKRQLSLKKVMSANSSPMRFATANPTMLQGDFKLVNAQNHIEHLDKILLSNGGTISPNLDQVSAHFGRIPSEHHIGRQIIREASEKEEISTNTKSNYLPTDIKHLEHIIQYTQPNQMTKNGSILCQKKGCLESYHSNQCLQKQIREHARKGANLQGDDKNVNLPLNTIVPDNGGFEEECENFMRNLQKYYEKFINNEHAFMQKSYLESNMFSQKRRTIENLIRNKQVEHGIIREDGQSVSELKIVLNEGGNQQEQFIQGLLNSAQEDKKNSEKQDSGGNPYAHLFGEYDYKYYNSKVPPPPKEPLGQPSGRKQVQLLNDWFESMMEQNVYKQKDFMVREDQRKKAFYYSKVILTICIRDIVRQVSVHCIERGAFMEKVLNIYLSIYEAELRAHLHDIDLQKEKHIEQIKNIREQTRQQLSTFEKLIDSLNVKIKEISQQRDRYQMDVEKMKETILKYQETHQFTSFRTGKSINSNKNISKFGGGNYHGHNPNHLGPRQVYDDMLSYIDSPLLAGKKIDPFDSDDSSDNSKYNLAMKKTKILNKAQEGKIQRQRVLKKGSTKRIMIADSSSSMLTDDDPDAKKKTKSQRGSSSSCSSFEKSESIKKSTMPDQEESKNVKFIGRNKAPQAAGSARTISSNQNKIIADDQMMTALSRSPKNEDTQLHEVDQQMIKDAINALFENQLKELKASKTMDENQISNGEEEQEKQSDYQVKNEVNDNILLDQQLDQIEKDQRLKLIQQIQEITSQIYKSKDGNAVIDAGSLVSQRDLVQQIVQQVMRNGQQTIQKLLERITDEDKHQLQKLLGDKKYSQGGDLAVNFADMMKNNKLSTTSFIKLAQKRSMQIGQIKKLFTTPVKGQGIEYSEFEGIQSKDVEMQTEDFNFIDYDQLTVQTAEIYMFDRVSRKLRKLVVEHDVSTNQKTYSQYEFSYKGQRDDLFIQLKSSLAKKLEAEFKFKTETKNKHYEINRANRQLKAILQRISELELEVFQMQVKKSQLELLPDNPSIIDEMLQQESSAFQTGYVRGIEQGRSAGYFKGYQEGKHFGHQQGFQDGVKEGWNFGYDDGYKNGIRKIFKECREAGINIEQLDILEYINKEDYYQGLKRFAFEKLFRIISKNEKLQLVYKLHEKFLQYNEKRKKRFAKMGRKNVIKMINQIYQQMIQSFAGQAGINQLGILEYMFDDFSKKYGNSKLAERKIMQILGSTYYHIDSHPKITFFGFCLHLGKRGYSNDVLFFYLNTMEKIQNSNVGINVKQDDKSDIDIVPYLKALDGIKIVFEDKIPIEGYGRIKQDVEKFTITKERAKVVDIDKLLEFIIQNFLRYSVILTSQLDQIYHAFTLFENYYMYYGELMMLVELINPDRLKVETENYKFIELEKKEFQNVFEKKKLELGEININIFQFRELFMVANITSNKNIVYCFDQAKGIMTYNQCKDALETILKEVKISIDDLYRGQKWKNLRYLEPKEYWYGRISRIEKSCGLINNQQVVIAATLNQLIINMYLNKRRELYGDVREDDEEVDLLDLNNNQNGVPIPTLELENLGFTPKNPSTTLQMLSSSATMRNSSVKRGNRVSTILMNTGSGGGNNFQLDERGGLSPGIRSSDSDEDFQIEELIDRQKRSHLNNDNFMSATSNIAQSLIQATLKRQVSNANDRLLLAGLVPPSINVNNNNPTANTIGNHLLGPMNSKDKESSIKKGSFLRQNSYARRKAVLTSEKAKKN